jgi:hypothetical protein
MSHEFAQGGNGEGIRYQILIEPLQIFAHWNFHANVFNSWDGLSRHRVTIEP